MPTYTPQDFAPLIATAISRPDLQEQMSAAMRDYFATPNADKDATAIFDLKPEIDALNAPFEAALTAALAAELKAAFDRGDAVALGEHAGATAFCDRWNSIARNGWDKVDAYVHEQMIKGLRMALCSHVLTLARDDPGPEAAALFVCDFLKTGTLEYISGGQDMFVNFADGMTLDVSFENWMPEQSYLGDDGARLEPIRMPDGKVFHQVVTFPTGNLLVGDSIRVGKYPEQGHDLMQAGGLSLNYAYHRIIRTSMSATTLGVVDIAVGDDGPGLVRDTQSSALFGGFVEARDDRFTEAANICHDYWGTMIADRQKVVEFLVAQGQSEEEANQEIEAWVADSRFNSEVAVTPGTWNLYWDDDREALDALLRENELAAPLDTRFVLTQDKLLLLKGDPVKSLVGATMD